MVDGCPLCAQGDRSVDVRCHACGTRFHVHEGQFAMYPVGDNVAARCPGCQAPNYWVRTADGIESAGGIVLYYVEGEEVRP